MADLAVHRAARSRRQGSTVDQRQSRVELVGEIGRPPAIIGKRGDSRQSVLITVNFSEARFHSPDCQKRPRRHAVVLLDRREHCRARLLQRAPARDDGRGASLGHKLLKGQTEASLATIRRDGRGRIAGPHQGADTGGGDAPSARFIGELALPRVKAGRRITALCAAGFARHPHKSQRRCQRDDLQITGLGHSQHPLGAPTASAGAVFRCQYSHCG